MKIWFLAVSLCAGVATAEPANWAASALDSGFAAYTQGDFAGARDQFGQLADHGSAIGETMLGTMYAKGEGVAADQATAVSYWYRAANRGYAPAQLALARARANGHGIGIDVGEAWVWAQLAIRHGDTMVRREATALAARIEPALTASARIALQRELDGWRPWPDGVR